MMLRPHTHHYMLACVQSLLSISDMKDISLWTLQTSVLSPADPNHPLICHFLILVFFFFLPYIAPLHLRWNDKAQILSFYQPSSDHARHHTLSLILLFFSFRHKPAIIDPATRHGSEYVPYSNHSFVSHSTFFCSGLSCRHSLLHLSLDLICTYWKQYEPKNFTF